MTVRTISSTSVHFTGTSRLPMVAGWDRLLPVWFTRLHPKYKTPIHSAVFVGIIKLVIAISSQIGAGIQEAVQLVDNAANVFYAIVYLSLCALPIFGTSSVRSGAPVWLRVASACGGGGFFFSPFFFFFSPFFLAEQTGKRRVGEKCRSSWWARPLKKKKKKEEG